MEHGANTLITAEVAAESMMPGNTQAGASKLPKHKQHAPMYKKKAHPDMLPAKSGSMSVRLQVASFLAGASIMILELTGSRLAAPFFGTSLIVWTALIGIMMTSLCIGNWLGGYAADRHPSARRLAGIFMASSVIIAATALGSNAVFSMLSGMDANLYVSSVLAALIIFAPASLLLGMTSPFIVRLAMRDVHSSGATVGRLSALNSAGSILGTFLGGFVLISLFPSPVILMILAAVLAVLAVVVYSGSRRLALIIAVCVLAEWAAVHEFGIPMTPVGEQIDTRYNHISVVESTTMSGRRVRIMATDPDGAQSLMYTDDTNALVSDYTKFYDLAFHYRPGTKRILMLGGGAYCVPRYMLSKYDDVVFDVVEIDPGITDAARKYFNLTDSPRLRIFHEGARAFLNRAVRDGLGPYDAVFMDVFGSWYSIPFQMTTVEAAERIRDVMVPDGVLISNVISSLEGPRSGVFHGIYSAFSRAFPHMMIFQASAAGERYVFSRQNLMIVALRSGGAETYSAADGITSVPDSRFMHLLANQWTLPFTPKVEAFTDDFAPVELYAMKN